MRSVFVQLNDIAQIGCFAVDAGAAITIDANLFESMFVIFAENFKNRCSDFDMGAVGQ